jgi:hypothetical protein
VRLWQDLHYDGCYSHSYSEALPDFVALARAFGWQAARVTRSMPRWRRTARICWTSPRRGRRTAFRFERPDSVCYEPQCFRKK